MVKEKDKLDKGSKKRPKEDRESFVNWKQKLKHSSNTKSRFSWPMIWSIYTYKFPDFLSFIFLLWETVLLAHYKNYHYF